MTVWTDELKAKVTQMYLDAEPTPESSTEIVKDIAEQLDQSPNGVRQVLVQAQVYVKKDVTADKSKSASGKSESTEGTKRVSKESQHEALRAAIKAAGGSVDDEIISKLTGKAAVYFTTVISGK